MKIQKTVLAQKINQIKGVVPNVGTTRNIGKRWIFDCK